MEHLLQKLAGMNMKDTGVTYICNPQIKILYQKFAKSILAALEPTFTMVPSVSAILLLTSESLIAYSYIIHYTSGFQTEHQQTSPCAPWGNHNLLLSLLSL